ATINIEILRYVNMLEQSSQSKVLAYIKSLFKNPGRKKEDKRILQFAGAFSKEDIREMNTAINEGCENPDLNEW
ncbi:MAG TPA: hypothetical protein VI757_08430, partial [Bacteroidia bacterium]|nr:hypothetical protein [Bacteroidia bacterium]